MYAHTHARTQAPAINLSKLKEMKSLCLQLQHLEEQISCWDNKWILLFHVGPRHVTTLAYSSSGRFCCINTQMALNFNC